MLENQEIRDLYLLIAHYHNKYLKEYGVKIPSLFKDKSKTKYTQGALVLIYLARGYPKTKPVTKGELTRFIRNFYPDCNDVQEARHLAAQGGWYIASGTRDNIVVKLPKGSYQLWTLEEPYPMYHGHRGAMAGDTWEEIKKKYNYRCATCGSKEGEPNFHWPSSTTVLQEGHKDPNIPSGTKNVIPQCDKCNRADRNNWVYDDRGRVIRIANAKVVLRSSVKVQKEILIRLLKKYNLKDIRNKND